MTFSKIIRNFLDLIFPRRKIVKKFESLNLGEITTLIPKADPAEKNFIYPALSYRNEMTRAIIWELKYRGNKKSAEIMGGIIYENILAEMGDLLAFENFKSPILVPIPLSNKRFRERGFNQMELVAKVIKKLDTENLLEHNSNLLIKIKNTEAQSKTKSRAKRLENLKGCFAISKNARDYARGRNIILIDDVTTTGSTLAEARKTLLKAGARKVVAFTVAH